VRPRPGHEFGRLALHPGDGDEQQADRAAEQLLRLPGPETAQTAEGSGRPAAARPLDAGGRPLPGVTRALMEGRFGHDFGQVRIHTDGRAADSARSMNALAYTVGRNVVFGAGQFEPQTSRGQRLLAHELAHVVQQAARPGGTPGLQRKKAKAAALWYQEAVDKLKVAEKDEYIPLAGPMLRKFVALAKAVDEEDAAAVPGLLRDFIGGDAYSLPPLFPSDPLAAELIVRMLLLGLNAESERFRAWQLTQPRRTTIKSMPTKEYFDEVFFWEHVLERTLARVPATDPDAAAEVLDALALLFEQLRNEAAGLDQNAIKADIDRRRATLSFTGFEWRSVEMSISMYSERLLELLRQTFAGIQASYQLVLERATADLGAAKGDRYLQVAREKLRRLNALVLPTDQPKQTGGVLLPVTRTEFKKRRGRHLDILAKGKAARKRTVGIEFYDVELGATDVEEKQLDFARVLAIRQQQLRFLERLFGLERDKGKATAETKENAAAIAKLGKKGFRLHSDDDWRKFLVEKFESHRARSGKAAALTAVIRLLEAYLQAFTTHTPYNIEDFGDNVLTRTFPRALTGQLLHDCGVYALRIAYMLSLLREHRDLQLRFRYILLPVHIGLIITGEDLPTYIAHNDRISVFSPPEIAELEQEWRRTDPRGQPRAPSRKAETQQFLGELAGVLFIPSADLPFKLVDVPHLRGGPAAMKRRLWRFYTATARTLLFGPQTRDRKSPHFQFHLRYLRVLEMTRTHFNTWVVPFWEAAHRTWLAQGPELTRAWQRLQSAKTSQERTAAQNRYDSVAARYLGEIKQGQDKVELAQNPVILAQVEIVEYLNEHPEVLAARIPRTRSLRQEEVFGDLAVWQEAVNDHLIAIQSRQKPDAPFARPEDLLKPID
jgi:hypothetical protein